MGNTELGKILDNLVNLMELGLNADPLMRPSITKFKLCLEQLLRWLNENEDPFKGVTVKAAVDEEELRTIFKDEWAKAQPPANPSAAATVERQIWPLHVYTERAKKFIQKDGVASGKEYPNSSSPLGNEELDLLAKAVARVQLIIDITLWLQVSTDSAPHKIETHMERKENAKQTLQNDVCEISKKLKNVHSAFTGAFLTLLRAHGPEPLRKISETQLQCFDSTTIQALFYLPCISNCKEAERTSLKTLESTMHEAIVSLISKLQSTKKEEEAIHNTQPNGWLGPAERIDALKPIVTKTVTSDGKLLVGPELKASP